MPIPGVDGRRLQKLDRCVKDVMNTGKSKDVAIAICRKSLDAAESDAAFDQMIEAFVRRYKKKDELSTDVITN